MKKIRIIIMILIFYFSLNSITFANDTLVYIDSHDIDSDYHRFNCSCITPNRYYSITVEQAFEKGYRKCPICEPIESDLEKKLEEEKYKERYEEAKEIINNVSSITNTTLNNADLRIVYITSTGSKYHLAGCNKLNNTPHSLTVSEATNKGYAPCKKCNPYNLADDFYENDFNPNILLFIIFVMLIILIIISLCFSSKKIPTTNIKGE